MLDLKKWIGRRLKGAGDAEADDAGGLNLAVAALLVEILRADHGIDPVERRQAVESLSRQLGLTAADSHELLQVAERRVEEAHDLHQFTSQINRAFGPEEKLRLVEQLWRVAIADTVIHKYEEHMIRRIADLLHVPHREFIAAKLRAAAPGQ